MPDYDERYAALVEMVFDDEETAKDWASEAEDLGYKMNGELEETIIELY